MTADASLPPADERRRPLREPIITVTLQVCSLCLGGAGGECHVPGCSFWMSEAPNAELIEVMKAAIPAPPPTYFVPTEFRNWDPDR